MQPFSFYPDATATTGSLRSFGICFCTDSAAAQATDEAADADEGGTLPDLEGVVRRAADRTTINNEDCPAGSAIRCREDHDKRHQG